MKKLLTMMAIASVTLTAQAQTTLKSGIDKSDMNTTVAPGTDFYEYACGGWMKKKFRQVSRRQQQTYQRHSDRPVEQYLRTRYCGTETL